MAESILLALAKFSYCLAEHVGTELSQEIQNLRKLPSKVRKIERELRMMNFSIRHTDTIDANDLDREWIVEVRKLAYRIEDIMDNFTYHALQLEEESFVVRQIKKLFYSKVFRDIISDITQIEEDVQHVLSLRDRYIQFGHNNQHQAEAAAQAFIPEVRFPQFVNDGDLVGIESYKDSLTKWLETTEQNSTVITVSGMGGLGKTTLVANVYERAKVSFKAHVWIAMSKKYTAEPLLKRLIRNISDNQEQMRKAENIEEQMGKAENIEEQMGKAKNIDELRKILNTKLKDHKTIVVLDDMWEKPTFSNIHEAFKDIKESRIIITTRLEDLTSDAQPTPHRLKLNPLNKKDAYDLFCKRAFANNKNHECPQDLEKLAKDIVRSCHGLPLAIVSIGILLSSKQQMPSVWDQIYNQLRYQLAKDDDVQGVINLSYHYLPGELRNCFLYCSMFPQNYYHSRASLVRLWVAEGFAVKTEDRTAEDVAEVYLMELINRNMLQLVEDDLGRMGRCKMHDIVRDLAMSIAKKVGFGTTNDYESMTMVNAGIVRRLSATTGAKIDKQMRLPHLRTLIAHGNTSKPSPDTLWSILLESRYLAVLELQDSKITLVPRSIGKLFNLRYLGLRGTKIKFLPNTVKKLSNLQTLDVKSTMIERLPRGIINVKKLRHLFADCSDEKREMQFRCIRGVAAPRALSIFQDLQTLETVEASKDLPDQLEKLMKLGSLSIDNISNHQCEILFAAVSKLPLLSSLTISACSEAENLSFKDLRPTSNKLKRLIVKGRWETGTLQCPIFQDYGGNIKYLEISWCQLNEDQLQTLALHLNYLTYLCLNRVKSERHIVIHAGSFQHLKTLFLKDMYDVISLKIEKGAIPCIEALHLMSMPNLGFFPEGIEFLSSLKKLVMAHLHPEFQYQWKEFQKDEEVTHIPDVQMI